MFAEIMFAALMRTAHLVLPIAGAVTTNTAILELA